MFLKALRPIQFLRTLQTPNPFQKKHNSVTHLPFRRTVSDTISFHLVSNSCVIFQLAAESEKI